LLALLLGRVRSRRDLADAVLRVAQMRRPLPRSAVLALTEVPPEHAALVTECVGYGDPVRPIAILRSRVRAAWPVSRERLDATHAAMAEQYGKLDGAVAAAAISTAEKMEAWVERAHHLAHAGPLGADSWSRLVLPAPELYWDRARHLSREREDYQGAAQVYRACVERFPNDDYAHHCLAWNLEKAGAPPEEPRLHFERAVHLASTNPWWNARHVTFLIGAGL
jgi:TolA-binding protein